MKRKELEKHEAAEMKIPWLKFIGAVILTAFALAVIVFSGAFLIWVQFQ